jgi:hypothetical protein
MRRSRNCYRVVVEAPGEEGAGLIVICIYRRDHPAFEFFTQLGDNFMGEDLVRAV